MLYSVASGSYINKLPHQHEFNAWMNKLNNQDYNAIIDELNNRIDGSDIETSSWIPGNDWSGSVFLPIYYACNLNIDASGLFFGLILYDLIIKRPEVWCFGRYEKDGVPIKGMTYFRLKKIP